MENGKFGAIQAAWPMPDGIRLAQDPCHDTDLYVARLCFAYAGDGFSSLATKRDARAILLKNSPFAIRRVMVMMGDGASG